MKIAFIGLGKLGMPCAEAIAEQGHSVAGYDKVSKISSKVDIKFLLKEAVHDRDIVFVATPTPHEHGYDGRHPTSHLPPKDFNYDSVMSVLHECNSYMNRNQILVLISTVLPGTTRKHFADIVNRTRFVYNPYLIAMGTVKQDFLNPEMIMIGTQDGGVTEEAKQLQDFYQSVSGRVTRTEFGTWDEIEAMKIFYNTFISTKIALVNMIQDVAVKNGNINVDRVTQALANSTQRIISKSYMRAGMGDGGACHPRDNIALRWLAKELELGYDLFESIMTARECQAKNMAQAILQHGKNICFSSDSYKSGTDLVDGSYSLLVQYYVEQLGGRIVNGLNNTVEVVVRVHESDQIVADNSTIIFDPWRTYPQAPNVVYYGK